MSYSAQGTRLNRRGSETRRHVLDVAIRRLAEGGPEPVTANLIAREAGVTWGTIQHQFGGADGVWAAVLEDVLEDLSRGAEPFASNAGMPTRSLHQRIAFIVDSLWTSYDSETARAMQSLRMYVPHDRKDLAGAFPATAATFRRLDDAWQAIWKALFDDLPVSPTKLRRVRSFLPGAVRGLHTLAQLTTFTDVEEGRRGLVDAVTAYLS
jgi:AcrR family transcriptional regulator